MATTINTDPFFHFSVQGTVLTPTSPPAALRPLISTPYLTMYVENRSTNPQVTLAAAVCSKVLGSAINLGDLARFDYYEEATIYNYYDNIGVGTYSSQTLSSPISAGYKSLYIAPANQTVLTCYIPFLSELNSAKTNYLQGYERIDVIVPLNLSATIADLIARGYASYSTQQLAAQSYPFSGTINGVPYSGQVALTALRSSSSPVACWQFYDANGAVYMAVETDTSAGPSVHFADDIQPVAGQSTSSTGVSARFARAARPSNTLSGTLRPFRVLSKMLQPTDQSDPPMVLGVPWAALAS